LWTHAINVGNVTDYMVVGLNKDATLFGCGPSTAPVI